MKILNQDKKNSHPEYAAKGPMVLFTILTLAGYVAVSSLVFVDNVFGAAPDIGGSVNISVSVENVTNTALASNSTAQVVVGSINSGTTSGDFNATVSVQTIINTALGSDSCSQVILGSVGINNC